jgi:hypothetical protein
VRWHMHQKCCSGNPTLYSRSLWRMRWTEHCDIPNSKAAFLWIFQYYIAWLLEVLLCFQGYTQMVDEVVFLPSQYHHVQTFGPSEELYSLQVPSKYETLPEIISA